MPLESIPSMRYECRSILLFLLCKNTLKLDLSFYREVVSSLPLVLLRIIRLGLVKPALSLLFYPRRGFMSGCFLFIYATLFSFVTFLHQLTSVITEILPNAILISASCKLKLLNSVESYGIKGILMQILKSLKIFVFM